jgi:glycosyltransferase involved in cell wall biosynthesis
LDHVVHNGVPLDGCTAAEPSTPATIGYLARQTREKGLELFVDAFIHLTRELGDTQTRLKIGGAATAGDQSFIAEMQQRAAAAGLAARVEWQQNLTREQKLAFLRSLTLFSVPATYSEAFGLYVIEAMACGVPVVQPASAAYPELVAATGGGICVPPGNAPALARGWQQLLADPARRAALGRAGRLGVEKDFSAARMAAQFLHAAARLAPVAA